MAEADFLLGNVERICMNQKGTDNVILWFLLLARGLLRQLMIGGEPSGMTPPKLSHFTGRRPLWPPNPCKNCMQINDIMAPHLTAMPLSLEGIFALFVEGIAKLGGGEMNDVCRANTGKENMRKNGHPICCGTLYFHSNSPYFLNTGKCKFLFCLLRMLS